MGHQRQFPRVHWIWKGAISFVYEVHPRVVVKVPHTGQFETAQFDKELKIYEIFSKHPPCPSIVQCFHYTHNGIFLEYMRGVAPLVADLLIHSTSTNGVAVQMCLFHTGCRTTNFGTCRLAL